MFLRQKNTKPLRTPLSGIPVKTGIHWAIPSWIPAFAGMLILIFSITPALAATTIPFTINMSEAVNVTGTPRIAVDVGGVTRYASYASGTGTSALTFNYDMIAGDVDLDGVSISSPIDLNGGTVKDLNGNDASLTFTVPNTSNVKVNYPSLGMDFTNGTSGRYTLNGTAYTTLSSFLTATGGTFTRNSIGTYFDSTGIMQTATTNTPRFDYDPSTPAAKGILLEESRTNQLKYSSDFSNALWFKSSVAVTLNAATAPDGNVSANKLTIAATTSSTSKYILQDSSITSGASYTQTFFVKAAELSYVQLAASSGFDITTTWVNFNLSNGTIGNHGSTGTYSIQPVGNGWYRISLTANATTTTTGRFILAISSFDMTSRNQGQTGDGTSGLYVWGAQLEQGAFPTSYIPTSGSTVTRAADSLTLPTGSWYNQNASSIFTSFSTNNASGGALPWGAVSFDDGSGNNAAVIRVSGAKEYYLRNSNTSVANATFGTSAANSILKSSIGFATNNVNGALDGTLGALDTSAIIPVFNTLRVGTDRGGGNTLNGHSRSIKYYPVRIPDTQLQLLTQ